jgi:hypothetical protein
MYRGNDWGTAGAIRDRRQFCALLSDYHTHSVRDIAAGAPESKHSSNTNRIEHREEANQRTCENEQRQSELDGN